MESLLEATGVYVGTLLVGILSGLVPVVNSELFIAVAIRLFLLDGGLLGVIAVGLLMALGEMIAKVGLYQAAQRGSELASGKLAVQLARARARVDKWRSKPLSILFISGVVGLPPFYLIALVAGLLRIRFTTFLWVGMVGRTIRFVGLAVMVYYV